MRKTAISALVLCLLLGLSVVAMAKAMTAKGAVTAFGFPQYSEAAIYLLMLLVLLVRPRGLLGERIVRFE